MHVRVDRMCTLSNQSSSSWSLTPSSSTHITPLSLSFPVPSLVSSELAQKVASNSLAESFMAFNTNYSDTGLFGVYASAKVGACVD